MEHHLFLLAWPYVLESKESHLEIQDIIFLELPEAYMMLAAT
jgi:hypothetical protein